MSTKRSNKHRKLSSRTSENNHDFSNPNFEAINRHTSRKSCSEEVPFSFMPLTNTLSNTEIFREAFIQNEHRNKHKSSVNLPTFSYESNLNKDGNVIDDKSRLQATSRSSSRRNSRRESFRGEFRKDESERMSSSRRNSRIRSSKNNFHDNLEKKPSSRRNSRKGSYIEMSEAYNTNVGRRLSTSSSMSAVFIPCDSPIGRLDVLHGSSSRRPSFRDEQIPDASDSTVGRLDGSHHSSSRRSSFRNENNARGAPERKSSIMSNIQVYHPANYDSLSARSYDSPNHLENRPKSPRVLKTSPIDVSEQIKFHFPPESVLYSPRGSISKSRRESYIESMSDQILPPNSETGSQKPRKSLTLSPGVEMPLKSPLNLRRPSSRKSSYFDGHVQSLPEKQHPKSDDKINIWKPRTSKDYDEISPNSRPNSPKISYGSQLDFTHNAGDNSHDRRSSHSSHHSAKKPHYPINARAISQNSSDPQSSSFVDTSATREQMVLENLRRISVDKKDFIVTASSRRGSEQDEDLKPRLSQVKRHWSIQAVKGKVTTSCLWNACKAFSIGTLLILIGVGMATVGYYADEGNFIKDRNATKPESSGPGPPIRNRPLPPPAQAKDANSGSRNMTDDSVSYQPKPSKFGLNKLSYVGPIVMGIGGFIIVAACVMTFEARDSAAKIVPARFRKSMLSDCHPIPAYRNTAAQTKWETLGVPGMEFFTYEPQEAELSRDAMTSAFIKFSKTIQSSMDSNNEYYDIKGTGSGVNIMKCTSAPTLVPEYPESEMPEKLAIQGPTILKVTAVKHDRERRLSSSPFARQALSVDNPAVGEVYSTAYPALVGEKNEEDLKLGASATTVHADNSGHLTVDLHHPKHLTPITLTVLDSSRSPSGNIDDVSPSVSIQDHYSASITRDRIETSLTDEKPGPSGIHRNYYRHTSPTYEKENFYTFGEYTANATKATIDIGTSTGAPMNERRKSKSSNKVKRSDTMDSNCSSYKKRPSHHGKHRHHHHHRERAGSAFDDDMNLNKVETSKKHHLQRQDKIDKVEGHSNNKK